MACAVLSPSPSGRRLSELLEEQQEPFSLDLHLLEKGCSPTLLDGYDATALCWPAAGADAVVLRRLTSRKSGGNGKAPKAAKKPAAAAGRGGILQLLLSKILRGRAAAQRKPAALQCSESFKMAAVAPSPCPEPDHELEEQQAREVAAGAACCDCSDSDCDDEKQQLSPVSVLEQQHPFETSPVHGHGKLSPSKNAMDVIRDLLDAAYSPALLTHLLARTDDLLRDAHTAADADDDDDCFYGSYRTSPKRSRDEDSAAAAYWDAQRAELARVSELVASEVPASSRLTPADVRPERQDVGAEVAAAVLESLVRELAADLGSC
ncbi:hypothetical protein BS78_05G277700 [Paspalum vaginatum]|nr:hypothetical protein BS78_05G277700 [Paspalum vaginatum]